MIEKKFSKNQVESLLPLISESLQHARNTWSKSFFRDASRTSWLTRQRIFEDGVKMLISNYSAKVHVFVLHYEGPSIEQARYLEVQMCSADNHNDVVGLFAVWLRP